MPRVSAWPARFTTPWLACAVLLGALAIIPGLFGRTAGLADIFLKEQDLPVALATVAFLMVLRAWRLEERRAARLSATVKLRPAPAATAAALAAAMIAAGGWLLVMRGYPLSTDEFLAGFDATIFREGRLMAVLPPDWRTLRFPMQPQYTLLGSDGASWSSAYLPVNALVQAAFAAVGAQALTGALWATVAIAAIYGIARRLWPERPDAALVAVALLATSTQFLVAPMTRYAMPAHLALNLVWLWLFLRQSRWSQLAAVGVAFLATGLHQVVFHPLFAAPFLLELWLAKRWRPAAFYTVAYLAIGLFWLSYWRLVFPSGLPSGGDARDIWLVQIRRALELFDPGELDSMAKGLFRFLTWQNPAAPALALLAAVPAIRLGAPFRPMVLGMGLLVAFMLFAVPDQGHGWGYRYLHGFLGSLCLLATLAWVRSTEAMDATARRAAGVGLAAIAAFSLLILLPWRAIQANAFVGPYAAADAAIRKAEQVDVVVVDATGMFYAADLVRNDPLLRNRPKVVDLLVMTEPQIRQMCASRRVAVFDRSSGATLRPAGYPQDLLARLAQSRRLMTELGCGREKVTVGP